MRLQKRTPLEWFLYSLVVIAFATNVYFLIETDNPPQWTKILNVVGWVILLSLGARQNFKQK